MSRSTRCLQRSRRADASRCFGGSPLTARFRSGSFSLECWPSPRCARPCSRTRSFRHSRAFPLQAAVRRVSFRHRHVRPRRVLARALWRARVALVGFAVAQLSAVFGASIGVFAGAVPPSRRLLMRVHGRADVDSRDPAGDRMSPPRSDRAWKRDHRDHRRRCSARRAHRARLVLSCAS